MSTCPRLGHNCVLDLYCSNRYTIDAQLSVHIFLLGKFDLDDCQIVGSNCNYQYDDRLASVVSAGYWPGNVSRDANYLFSQDLLDFFDTLHKCVPSLSTGGFIRTLELSADNARVCCSFIIR